MEKKLIEWSDFEKIDIRVGTVIIQRLMKVLSNPLLSFMLILALWVSKKHLLK